MKIGHKEAQEMFLHLGEIKGYTVRKSWSAETPTDGVWLFPHFNPMLPQLPAVAIEVAVSEGKKSLRGSIDVLREVSPSLGLILIQEEEIRRNLIRKGRSEEDVYRVLERANQNTYEASLRTSQRIEIWSFSKLQRRFQVETGKRSILSLNTK